jgi:hypothetical protein
MNKFAIFDVCRHFDHAPNSMLVDIETAVAISRRSRASIYRHVKAGELSTIKVGSSTRIRVGDLRRLIQAEGGAK